MLNIFYETAVVLNDPGRETITAGLGPIMQYGIPLLVLIIVVIVYYIRKRKNKNIHEDILKVKKKRKVNK